MINACIFDLDGVIVDTAKFHFLAWKRLADELGIPFDEKTNERLKGVSRMQSLEIILEVGTRRLSAAEKEELATRKNAWFVEFVEAIDPSEIFPGVRKLLEDMRSAGLKIALASSSKNAQKVIERLGVADLFDAMVDGNMIVNSKPHPEVFLKAAALLGADPRECLVFEDAEAGVEAALAAGMKCVGVGDSVTLHKAHRVVSTTGSFPLTELKNNTWMKA